MNLLRYFMLINILINLSIQQEENLNPSLAQSKLIKWRKKSFIENLTKNILISMNISHGVELKYLNLCFKNIKNVDEYTFSEYESLVELKLCSNDLTNLNSKTFHGLNNTYFNFFIC